MTRLAPCILLAALAGCAAAAPPPRLEIAPVPSAILGHPKELAVLRPPPCPGFDPAAAHVVYFLHGYGGDHRSLDEKGLSTGLFLAQAEGRIARHLLVAPDGEQGFYLNWHDGSHRYEDYLVEEVIPAAERHLGISVTRERRHLVGVSMGGYGATLVGLRHPELFESVASISGVLFDEDRAVELARSRLFSTATDINRLLGDGADREFLAAHNPYSLLLALSPERRPRLFVAVGDDEPAPFRRSSEKFHSFLDGKGVAHEWVRFDGSHRYRDWGPVIERALRHAVGAGRQTVL